LDTRRLLSSTVLYGIADIIVLAVGGFLLLPLYTRTLSQEEFGIYVIFRANTEIFTYLLFFGLPSAVGRLYFEYKKVNQHVEYMSSVVMFFLIILITFSIVLLIWGDILWMMLSPGAPVEPYLGFSMALAAIGFYAAIGSIWLRMEGRVIVFIALQVAASLVLAAVAVTNLVVFDIGLSGLLYALLSSAACSALVLPWLFGLRFRPMIRWVHIAESLHYAVPIVIGYVAYFVLNRMSTVILQHHVGVDQVAIFGLAQQLSMIVTIAATAFGKALQPVVFAVDPVKAAELMEHTGKIFMMLMYGITSVFVMFASEIFSLIAPKSYSDGYDIFLILLIASFAYSFSLISNTTLLYYRRPKTSVAVLIVGAILALLLGVWLIPLYQLS
jgi:O-antigen/teichoic acid export membrane protein